MRARSCDAVGGRCFGALLASGLLLAGCGTPRLLGTPQPAADLSGHWILDPAASDDAAKLIAAILPKPKPRPPPDQQPVPLPQQQQGQGRGPGGGRGGQRNQAGSQGSNPPATQDQPTSWGKVRPVDFVSAFAVPPPRLDVAQRPERVVLATGDARRRDFEPGDEQPFSVTDRYGSRKVRAGWHRDEFVVDSEDGSRLTVVEHYHRRADDHLELLVEFKSSGLKSLSVHSLYRRATSEEIATPSADGPPAPAPR